MGFWNKKPPLNAHAVVSSGARGLNFGLSIHPHPYFVYASNEGSGKPAQVNVASTEITLAGLYYLILFVNTGNRSIQAAYK